MESIARVALAGAAMLAAATAAAADVPATIDVDWRGLPQVRGIVRENSKADWGFANFVAFGPGWAYSAQDYAAKEHKKERLEDSERGTGLLFTAKMWAGSRGFAIREEFFDVSTEGHARVHVLWTIESLDGKPMALERAYVRFPLALNDFGGGKNGNASLPEEYGEEWIGIPDKSAIDIVSKDGRKRLLMSVAQGNAVIWDGRKEKQQRFELRLEFPGAKTETAATIEFEVEGLFADAGGRAPGKVDLAPPPPQKRIVAGDDWCEFPWTNDVKDGSILDFSSMQETGAPAGKFGFAKVGADGHFVFENDPQKKPRRFVGGNLCFNANFPSREEAARAVRDFKMRGWNAIRFHHIDVTITKDEWNRLWDRRTYPEIDPAKLDRLDWFLAECKKAGIYVTFDLYCMGALGSCEGFDKPLNSNTVKAVVPIHGPAEDLWFKRAMELLDHVNPYTGVKWKDEPAILFATLMNEDSIASVWWGAKNLYIEKFREWLELNMLEEPDMKELGKSRNFAEFLYEVKANANRRMSRRLREAGVKTLISGGNWWDNMAQVFEREELDVVDNHQYSDHPEGGGYRNLPFHIHQSSSVSGGHPTYATPVMMAPTRIYGKPFTVTEWNFCNPNNRRSEAGLMMGAYAALQDWDALYRFAWSHDRGNMFAPSPAKGFDIVTDPVGQLTERQVALLFGRGDVSPARVSYAYAVTKGESMAYGLGDMWAKGLFPHPFTQLAYVSRVGSFSAEGGRAKPALQVDKIYGAASRKGIQKFDGAAKSDTGEISIDRKAGTLTVASARSAGVVAPSGTAALSAGPLSVGGVSATCSVSASSMDGRPLNESGKILLFHITDVKNAGATFTNDKMTDLSNWGKLPLLAKTGKAEVSLATLRKGLKAFALAPDGSRLREIPARMANGAISFTVEVKAGAGVDAPVMAYEIAE